MIFVQIAAYRDPELLPTIADCLAKAKHPNDLRFGICWQKHPAEKCLDPLRGRKNFTIDEVPWHESKGLCWARARIQKLHQGEEFTLQLDSHHRFAPDWDADLLRFMELTGSPRPILTSYANIYEPRTNEKKGSDPFKMVADKFTASGTILFRPHVIPGWRDLEKPVRARFVSGHFFFTLGRHCEDYAYDPSLYFAGDEISLSIRSYTLGYDLFHPHRNVVWHEYTRKGRVKHWDDHTVAARAEVGLAWHERDQISKRRLRKMLREEENDEDITGYGLGGVRAHGDYERYAGIDFGRRRLHRETVTGIEPPCSSFEDGEWVGEGAAHPHRIALKWKIGDIERCDDYQFIYFGVEDASGKVLYRFDAPPESDEARLAVHSKEVEFQAGSAPSKLVVWPVSRSRGWLKKVEYQL